ncbi:flippase [Patescibacteria group bacterium]|nr:flippase [Patescibacteria group bacterium]
MVTKLLTALGAKSPKRYLKGALWITISKFLSIIVSLAATFYIARTLGPQNLGELSYAVSIVNLLAFFSAIASATVVVRDLVREEVNQRSILGTGWVLMVLGTLVTIVGVFGLTFYLPHNDITFFVVGLLCLAQILSSFTVAQNIFYAKADTKYLSVMQLVVHITISIMKIIAMTQNQGVLVLAGIMLLEQMLTATITVYMYTKYTGISIREWYVDLSYAKRLALDSIPFVFISMSIVISGRIDQVLLKHFLDTAAVGYYSVAVQLTEIWQVLPMILLASLLPALVNAHAADNNYGKRILALTVLIGGYSLTASLATTLLAPMLIPIIYGEAFTASIPLVQIYVWSLFGVVAGFLISNILATENKRRIQIMVGFLPMVLNVILNLLWIPEYGGAGAAWATVISYSVAPIIPFFYSSIRQKLNTRKIS